MEFKVIANQIIELKNNDLTLRQELLAKGLLNSGYNSEMAKLHKHNANVLNEIIDKIGYPTIGKVGEEANSAAWLIVQHAIGYPNFMRKCREFMREEVQVNQASPIQLAYLTDRIAVFEGNIQLYGTQFDWDLNGELSPNAYDSLKAVNQRRKRIGLNSMEEQTEIVRKRAIDENQTPPHDIEARQIEYNDWRKKVGWI